MMVFFAFLHCAQNFKRQKCVTYPKSLSHLEWVCVAIPSLSRYLWSHKCNLGGVGVWQTPLYHQHGLPRFGTKCFLITCFRRPRLKFMPRLCDLFRCAIHGISLEVLDIMSCLPSINKRIAILCRQYIVGDILLISQRHFSLHAKLLVQPRMEKDFAWRTTTSLHHVRQQTIWMDHMTTRANDPCVFGSPRFSTYATKTPILDPRGDAWPQQGWCGRRYHNTKWHCGRPLDYIFRSCISINARVMLHHWPGAP